MSKQLVYIHINHVFFPYFADLSRIIKDQQKITLHYCCLF